MSLLLEVFWFLITLTYGIILLYVVAFCLLAEYFKRKLNHHLSVLKSVENRSDYDQ
jgi:hypothetical protein